MPLWPAALPESLVLRSLGDSPPDQALQNCLAWWEAGPMREFPRKTYGLKVEIVVLDQGPVEQVTVFWGLGLCVE